MSQVVFENVKIVGLSCAVPKQVVTNEFFMKFLEPATVKNIEKMTGVKTRRYASLETCASDLCFAAAEDLLQKIGWAPETIDAFVFLTQTPDHPLPGTSGDLHRRLNLSTECATFDVSLSCAGYVYGLWLCSSLMVSNKFKRVLFLNGDITSRDKHGNTSENRATAQLFGDAGAATAFEFDPEAPKSFYILGADGNGYKNLNIPAGGFRKHSTDETRKRTLRPDGSFLSDEETLMDGAEIFKFSVERVPEVLEKLKNYAGLNMPEIDYFLFHQANKFILTHLSAYLKLPKQKVPISIEEFGNTSSGSIPLTMVARIAETLTTKSNKLVLTGFGAGYTWASAYIDLAPLKCASLIEI